VQKYYHDLEGYNGRLDAIQAAFLRIKLRHLETWNGQRRTAAARYRELLANVPGVVLPAEAENSKGIYHLFVIRTDDREGLGQHLKEQNIHTGLHYPLPVHLQNCYKAWGYQKGSLPVTEKAALEILSLPMFPGLTAEQQDRVAAGIGTFPGLVSGTVSASR
jgi:dTDP-4-amino-4,6-dideoxygalactose transaminase